MPEKSAAVRFRYKRTHFVTGMVRYRTEMPYAEMPMPATSGQNDGIVPFFFVRTTFVINLSAFIYLFTGIYLFIYLFFYLFIYLFICILSAPHLPYKHFLK
jgi:hypothetical protein